MTNTSIATEGFQRDSSPNVELLIRLLRRYKKCTPTVYALLPVFGPGTRVAAYQTAVLLLIIGTPSTNSRAVPKAGSTRQHRLLYRTYAHRNSCSN